MNKNEFPLYTSVLALLLILTSFCAADAASLANRYLLTFNVSVSGNIADSTPVSCQYALNKIRGGGRRKTYRSVDCTDNYSTITITKTGNNIFTTIPFLSLSTVTDGFNVIQSIVETRVSCNGSVLSSGVLSATCSGSYNDHGLRYIITGSFNAAPLSRQRRIEASPSTNNPKVLLDFSKFN